MGLKGGFDTEVFAARVAFLDDCVSTCPCVLRDWSNVNQCLKTLNKDQLLLQLSKQEIGGV